MSNKDGNQRIEGNRAKVVEKIEQESQNNDQLS
jgi:hypothetical protein